MATNANRAAVDIKCWIVGTFPAAPTGNDRFEGAHTGTGNVPYNWRQTGDFSDAGVFGLTDFKFSERLGVILSARWDTYEAATFGTTTSPVYAYAEDKDDSFTYNASLNYKITEDLIPYLTYSESNYLELGQGGMLAKDLVANGTWLQESKLTEVGIKGTLLNKRLYATLAYYEQEKTSYDTLSGAFDYYESSGVELEARYAPTRNLSFTATGTWQHTDVLNPPFILGVPPTALGLDPNLTYGGRFVAVGALIGVTSPLQAPTPERVFSVNGNLYVQQRLGLLARGHLRLGILLRVSARNPAARLLRDARRRVLRQRPVVRSHKREQHAQRKILHAPIPLLGNVHQSEPGAHRRAYREL